MLTQFALFFLRLEHYDHILTFLKKLKKFSKKYFGF